MVFYTDMKNILIILLIGILVVGLMIGYLLWQDQSAANAPDYTSLAVPVTYLNIAEGSSVSVAADPDAGTVIFNGLGFESVTLSPVVTEDESVRYESTETGISVWDRGERLTVYAGEAVLFDGYTEEAALEMGDPVVNDENIGLRLLAANTWIWEETITADGSQVTPATPGAFTLTFSPEGQLSGTTDCNNFNAPFSLENTALYVSDFAMTRMFCENSQEAQFLNMIASAQYIFFTAEQDLTLLLADDAGSVVFSKAE